MHTTVLWLGMDMAHKACSPTHEHMTFFCEMKMVHGDTITLRRPQQSPAVEMWQFTTCCRPSSSHIGVFSCALLVISTRARYALASPDNAQSLLFSVSNQFLLHLNTALSIYVLCCIAVHLNNSNISLPLGKISTKHMKHSFYGKIIQEKKKTTQPRPK